MKKFWEYFENMNESVYAVDMETHEFVFLNKKLRQLLGVSSIEDFSENKCYKIMQNFSSPCKVCTNKDLKPNEFIEWDYYNPKAKKHFVIKDTLIEDDGRKICVKIALDADASEWQKTAAASRQNLETIANECLRIATSSPHPDKSLDLILEYIGSTLNAERTYIFEKQSNGCDSNTYEWTAGGIKPLKELLQNLPRELCENWYKLFMENKPIVINNLEDIAESDPIQYEVLKRRKTTSFAVVPLYDNHNVIGFYGVDNPPAQSLDYALDILQILGHFIVSSIKQRELIQELHDMTCHDYLTKLGNRHAMNNFISQMKQEQSAGVVYCDLTGLKRVNDTEGHTAGDELIINASKIIKGTFCEEDNPDIEVFRIGGDEFLVLCKGGGITESSFNTKIENLKIFLKENSIIISIGAAWREKLDCPIDNLMREAERSMYEDKSLYYRTSGIERRR